jgi:flagellar biosynthesis protein FlhG
VFNVCAERSQYAFGGMPDQAAGLRQLLGGAPLRAIALAGAGATTLTANLAVALGMGGADVVVVDENANHGNVADQLGVATRCELLHALNGERALHEVMAAASHGVRLLPAARGVRELEASGDDAAFSTLAACLRTAPPPPDLILIDSASGGVSRLLRQANAACQAHCETVIVCGASHDAITSAYGLIKAAARDFGETRFRVIVNRARSQAEAEGIFRNMAAVAAKHAGASLQLLGWMPNQPHLKHARSARRSVIEMFPASASAVALRELAQRLRDGTVAPQDSGFGEQAAHAAAAIPAGALALRKGFNQPQQH